MHSSDGGGDRVDVDRWVRHAHSKGSIEFIQREYDKNVNRQPGALGVDPEKQLQ